MATDAILEFSDVFMENLGNLSAGRLKFSDRMLDFKNSKTGKIEHINSEAVELCSWIRLCNKAGLRLTLKSGVIYRFGGFADTDHDRLNGFLKHNWSKELNTRDPCVRGWNWGTSKFHGESMVFEVENQEYFEIPLGNVSNATTGKNEVALEFHQNDEAAVSLMEMRFYIPTDATGQVDRVESFSENVMAKAGIIQATGTALATLPQIYCATPRGRYDIKIFPTFIHLHGKTNDYKIPVSTILRLFLLPHKDGRHMYFVISLDPPIKQGQTRYHFLILEFNKEDEIELEPELPEEVMKEKYGDKLTRENMRGPLFEVVSRIMKTVVNRRITVPGSFVGHLGTSAISCAYKQAAGFLYPLERAFIYVHKPPIHIRFEEIASVNFARSDVSTRSFDFEIELTNGTSHNFNSIEKEEYNKLYDFVNTKKLRIRNTGKLARSDKASYDEFEDSEGEEELDPYKERLKKEADEREEEAQGASSSDSEDSDFRPDEEKSEPEEEYDSAKGKSSSSGSDSEGGGPASKPGKEGGASDGEARKPKKRKKKSSSTDDDKPLAKTSKKATTSKSVPDAATARKRREKARKDPNAPKKNQTAYMIWFGANRQSITEPGMSVPDVGRKAGRLWKELTPADKTKWEKMAADDKVRYERDMQEYKKNNPEAAAGATSSKGGGGSKGASKAKSGASLSKAPISKETVSSSGSEDEKEAPGSNKSNKESSEETSASSSSGSDSASGAEED